MELLQKRLQWLIMGLVVMTYALFMVGCSTESLQVETAVSAAVASQANVDAIVTGLK
jgi:hypothetical protein